MKSLIIGRKGSVSNSSWWEYRGRTWKIKMKKFPHTKLSFLWQTTQLFNWEKSFKFDGSELTVFVVIKSLLQLQAMYCLIPFYELPILIFPIPYWNKNWSIRSGCCAWANIKLTYNRLCMLLTNRIRFKWSVILESMDQKFMF